MKIPLLCALAVKTAGAFADKTHLRDWHIGNMKWMEAGSFLYNK